MRKGRSLHTHTIPCVQLYLSPLSVMGISLGFCHCFVTAALWVAPCLPTEDLEPGLAPMEI